jgi:uncharacterized protein
MKINRLFFKLAIGVSLFFSPLVLIAQDLPRRSFLGIQMNPLPAELRKLNKATTDAGILISNVINGSTAAKAGFQKDDILFEFDGKPVTSPAQMAALMRSYSPGQQLGYKLLRDNKLINKKLTIAPLPLESHEGIKTTYGSVISLTGEHRTILMEPMEKGKYPAILFIQGIGCYSIDSPLDTLRSDIQLLSTLTKAGFVTLRVEKSNIGDSKGKPCEQMDLKEELAGYKAAYEHLESLSTVDIDNIFIIGHSMGGVMAPLLAIDHKIKGIVAYGTLGVNFLEYYINSRRNITEAYEMGTAEADDFIKREGICMAQFMASLHKDQVELSEICPELSGIVNIRDISFWKQLFELNLPQVWTKFNGNLLAIRGESDFVSTREEHEYIAELVNKSGGKGKFLNMPNADHGMNYAETYQQAIRQPGPFNQEVSNEILAWLRGIEI